MELSKAADTLVKEVLLVKKGENLLIYADTGSDRLVTEATAAAAYRGGAVPMVIWVPTPAHPDMEPPKPVREALKTSDVICEFESMYIYHTKACIEASKMGARILCLSKMDAGSLVRLFGPKVNFSQMIKLGDKLAELTRKAKKMRVTSSAGTDVTWENAPKRPVFHHTGILDKLGKMSPPGGQIAWAPVEETMSGVLVFDGFVTPPVGLVRSPVKLTIERGRIVKIEGRDEASKLERYLKGLNDPNMYLISHICYGFHPGAELSGNVVEDERVPYCVEMGFGIQSKYLKRDARRAASHFDGGILNPSVWLDDILIEKDNTYVHPELAKLVP